MATREELEKRAGVVNVPVNDENGAPKTDAVLEQEVKVAEKSVEEAKTV